MAEDIVTGLFGLTPQAVEEQRRAAAAQDIMNFQNLDLGQQSAYLAGQAGYGIGRKIGGMLGMVDPLVEQAQMRQAILANLDPNDPESYLKVAKVAQNSGDVQTAMRLKIVANNMAAEQRKLESELAKQQLAERKQTFQEEEALSLKKQALDNQFEIAKMRSEDTRLNAEQRAQAAKDANDTRLMIAQLMAQSRIDAAGMKQTETATKREEGRQTVDDLVSGLHDYYEQLQEIGGITDPKKGAIANIASGIASSGVGQAVGKLFGTHAQSIRNSIIQQRPLLMQAIKEATGMSAKQMDSNVELKMYLAASTDPALDIDANLAALKKINELYGLGKQNGEKAKKPGVKTWDPKTGKWEIK